MLTKEQLEGLNVGETVALVLVCTTAEELELCRTDETRKGVLEAVAKREAELAELAKEAGDNTGAGEGTPQDVESTPDTKSDTPDATETDVSSPAAEEIAGNNQEDADEEDAGLDLPSCIRLIRPCAFYDDANVLHQWFPGFNITDPEAIAEIFKRGGSFEVIA